MTETAASTDPGPAALAPYLAVAGARDALRWYVEVLGARMRDEPIVMPDGRIGHAELDLGGARLMLSEEHPEIGVVAPDPDAGSTVTLHMEVPDTDAVVERAVRAGARLERAPVDEPYGRMAVVRDPFGHRWMFSGPVRPPRPRAGDLAYCSLWVRDVDRAAEFFAAVLGWRYQPAGPADGRQVIGLARPHGIQGGQPRSTLFCCFAVDDVLAAVARVRSAGGQAGEPRTEPFGIVSDCTDDQGERFALLEPPGGTSTGADGPAAGQGDLGYVALETADSARARAFYGAVLGWQFTPGSVPDGWQVAGVAPPMGLRGGSGQPTAVPLYRVDDIAAAVGRVRDAGGRATEPESAPYGVTSSCLDDQGTRFIVAELT